MHRILAAGAVLASLVVPASASAAVGFAAPESRSLGSLSGEPLDFVLTRIDGDAITDLALDLSISTSSHGYVIRRPQSDRAWTAGFGQTATDSGAAAGLALGDVNGDGLADLVDATTTTMAVVAASPPGGSYTVGAGKVATGTGFGAPAIGQWTSSSPRPEVVYPISKSGPDVIGVLDNAGGAAGNTAPVTNGTPMATLDDPRAVAVADVDADGNGDLVVSANAGVEVIRGNGGGNALSRVDRPLPTLPSGLAVGDLDGDGRPDVAVALPSANVVRWFPSAGLATTPAAGIDLPIGAAASDLAIADLDGDGRNEIITANPGAGTISVVAPGVPARAFPSMFTPRRLEVADVSRDGRLDVVTLDPTTRTLTSLLGFEPAPSPAPAGPSAPPPTAPGPPAAPAAVLPSRVVAAPGATLTCKVVRRRGRRAGVDCAVKLPAGVRARSLKAVLRRGRATVATKTITKGTTLRLRRSRGRSLARGAYAVTLTVTPRAGAPLTARRTLTVR